LRVGRFAIEDSGQRHEASHGIHQRLQQIKAQPEVIGVEELVHRYVLELFLILL
jgi:hypothetical protein